MNFASPQVVAPGTLLEFVLSTEAEIAALGVKPTAAQIYGELLISNDFGTAALSAFGAWGVRFVESDAAVTTTVFSPVLDSETTDWITWRGWVTINNNTNAAGGDGGSFVRIPFNIRNPRIAQGDTRLTMIFESIAGSDGDVNVGFWNRVGWLLP